MDNISLIRDIAKYLGKSAGSGNVKLPRTNSLYNHIPQKHRKKDELLIYLTEENKLFVYSAYESHHNGSSFGEDENIMDFPEILQIEVLNELKKEYKKSEFIRLEKVEEQHRIARIESMIITPEEKFRI